MKYLKKENEIYLPESSRLPQQLVVNFTVHETVVGDETVIFILDSNPHTIIRQPMPKGAE